MPADLIILAAIVIFVLLRLRAVLGRKNGLDQPPILPREAGEERIIQVGPKPLPAPVAADPEIAVAKLAESLREPVREAMKIDANFSVPEFLKGARSAFEMVIEAFSKDDRETLKNLLSKEVYDHFAGELDQRAAAHRRIETTLVAIPKTEVKSIEMKRSTARVVIAFESEQIEIVRDEAGTILEGDASRIETIDDEWTFERDLKSVNPNWKIVAT